VPHVALFTLAPPPSFVIHHKTKRDLSQLDVDGGGATGGITHICSKQCARWMSRSATLINAHQLSQRRGVLMTSSFNTHAHTQCTININCVKPVMYCSLWNSFRFFCYRNGMLFICYVKCVFRRAVPRCTTKRRCLFRNGCKWHPWSPKSPFYIDSLPINRINVLK